MTYNEFKTNLMILGFSQDTELIFKLKKIIVRADIGANAGCYYTIRIFKNFKKIYESTPSEALERLPIIIKKENLNE